MFLNEEKAFSNSLDTSLESRKKFYRMQSDERATVIKLIESIQSVPGKTTAWVKSAQQALQTWRNLLEPLFSSAAVPIRPERLCKTITEMLPEDAVTG